LHHCRPWNKLLKTISLLKASFVETSNSTPDYFEKSFPKDGFPAFDWTNRPSNLPPDVWTTETTHRDGQQGGLPLTKEQSLKIYDILCKFTGKSGAIRQAEFFVYRDSDKGALEGALERYKSGAPIEPTSWIRAARKDVELIRSFGLRETGMLASISDFHVFHKFKPGGRREAAKSYKEAIQMVLDCGIKPRIHLEDATRASLDFMLEFIADVQKISASYDKTLQPKFRICDTMGLGLPFDFVDAPRSVPRIFRSLREAGLVSEQLEFHPHNDTWMIVPNCIAALMEGCSVINGTSLGKGERTGNAPLEAVIMHMIGMGYFKGAKPDFIALNELADFYSAIGHGVPAKYPLYGRDAHRTRAGIHADGLNKFWSMYAPFDVPKLLGRPLEVSLTKDSGVAGLVFMLRQHTPFEVSKDDPRIAELRAWTDSEFDGGRQTSIEWEELEPRVEQIWGKVNGSHAAKA
jgi:2-phosphinomethylmalic acid synthase